MTEFWMRRDCLRSRLQSVTAMGGARLSLRAAAGSTSGGFGQGSGNGDGAVMGQAAAGVQMLTRAMAVRVLGSPRPAPGNAWRALVMRSRCR